jgi:hypothetical protein
MNLAAGSAEERFQAHYARVRQRLAAFDTLPAAVPSTDAQRLAEARSARAAQVATAIEGRAQPALLFLVFFGPLVALLAGVPEAAAWLSSVSFVLLVVVLLADGLVSGLGQAVGPATARLTISSPPPAVVDPLAQLPSQLRNAHAIASSARQRLTALGASVGIGTRAGEVEREADRLLSALAEGHGDGERLLDLAAEVVALEETLAEHDQIVEGRIAPHELSSPMTTTAGVLEAMSLRETAVEEALGDADRDRA